MNDIRVLLVENEPGDAGFIQEALAEMEEMTHGGTWVHCRVSRVERAQDAVLVLEAEPPEVVLFNPVLPDSRGLATFSALRDAAPGVPLIALLDSCEESLGRRMLRQGAQDFIIKSEVDCRPLARALLNAIERQRFERAAARVSAVDAETGFYNGENFRTMAARDLELARECGRPVVVVAAEIDNFEDIDATLGREAAHELVVEAANVIRTVAGGTVLTGRSAVARFHLLVWHDSADSLISSIQSQVQAGLHAFAFVFGYAVRHPSSPATIDDLIRTANAVLYENRQAYLNLN